MNKEPELRDYIGVIARHRSSIYVIVLTSLLVSFALSAYMPEYYEAVTDIYVPVNNDQLSLSDQKGILKTAPIPVPSTQVLASHLGILRSSALAQKIADKIPERSMDSIEKNTRISVKSRYYNFRIFVRDRDPAIAAKIANYYAPEANKHLQDMSLAPVKNTRANLEQRILETDKTLQEAEKDLKQFKLQHNMASPAEEEIYLTQQRAVFSDKLNNSKIQLAELKPKIHVNQSANLEEEKNQSEIEPFVSNPVIDHLKKTLSSFEISLIGALSKYSEEHPDVVRLKSEYSQTKKNLDKEMAKLRNSRQTRVTELERVIKDLDAKIAKFPEIDNKLAILQRRVSSYERALALLSMELEETKLQESRTLQTFAVLDKAEVPKQQSFPDPFINTIIAGLLALFVGIFYVFVMEYIAREKFDNRDSPALLEYHDPMPQLIGNTFKSLGLLNSDQVLHILDVQEAKPDLLFGELAIKLGYISPEQVEKVIEIKKTPALPSKKSET